MLRPFDSLPSLHHWQGIGHLGYAGFYAVASMIETIVAAFSFELVCALTSPQSIVYYRNQEICYTVRLHPWVTNYI